MRTLLGLLAVLFFLLGEACPAADPDIDATRYKLNQEVFYLADKERSLAKEVDGLSQRADSIQEQIRVLAAEFDATQAKLRAAKHELISVQLQMR